MAAYLTLPVLWFSPFESLGDINSKDPCKVNTGYLIPETAVIPCIVLFCDILILFLACLRNNKPSVLSTFTLSKPSFYTSRVSMFYNADRSAVIILTRLQSKSQYKCSNISVNSPWKIFLLRNLSQKLDHFGCITLHNLRKTSWSLSLLKEQSWLAKSQCNSP